MSSDTSSSSSDEDYRTRRPDTRVAMAKKSTSQPTAYTTRRQAALAKDSLTKRLEAEKFLGNFNPETSIRERKKLSRKINPPSTVRKPPGALYDENGILISTGDDLCDCLNDECTGCFFECTKCNSQKCGLECRVHRKFMYDQIEFHGYDTIFKNPLAKH
ncbi:hypothetical protein HHI36_014512 [Cryptolaemus montrouzieri]|uniref:ARF7 effector protein C-terminal domain-containing protein n=1 Tax=Cryptolaemus montrouzieri TaxID=559131 RepID=A0ABD2N3Q3_9CUCU